MRSKLLHREGPNQKPLPPKPQKPYHTTFCNRHSICENVFFLLDVTVVILFLALNRPKPTQISSAIERKFLENVA